MTDSIYLDYAATTPTLPEVADAVREAMLTLRGNASGQHAAARRTRRAFEDACEQILGLLSASTASGDRLLLTSGGTESNNHALRGALPLGGGGHLVTSSIEHPSVSATARRLQSEGCEVDWLPVDATGETQLDTLPSLVKPETRLISLMQANSETGVLQPVDQVVEFAAEHGVAVHTDATQVVGRGSLHFGQLGAAMMSFAAHKFYGPLGIGGLLVRGDCRIAPLLAGQADVDRPGTPAAPLVIGMARALEIACAALDQQVAHLEELQNRFEQGVLATVPAAVVIGARASRLPHISSVAFAGFDRQALLIALDRQGVACSTGTACASGSSEPSPVLTAMGLPEDQIRGALRFSFGRPTTATEIDETVARISSVCKQLSR